MFRRRFDVGAAQECPDPFALTASDLRGVVVPRLGQDDASRLWHQRLRRHRVGRVVEARLLPRGSRARRIVKRLVVRTSEPFEVVVTGGADDHWYQTLRRHRVGRVVEARLLPRGSRARRIVKRLVVRTSEPFEVVVTGGADEHASVSLNLAQSTGAETRARANVIGYWTGEFGVAEAARLVVRAAQAHSVDVALINVGASETAREEDLRLANTITDRAIHPINILCVNADQTKAVPRASATST